jgi:hypothetical protein
MMLIWVEDLSAYAGRKRLLYRGGEADPVQPIDRLRDR